ncbi:MAG: hypothetical protein AAF298_22240, partial [Cyanobacteria bacterium P01_A01_bin.40]
SQKAKEGFIIGIVIGLSVVAISQTIHGTFPDLTFTRTAKLAEFLGAVLVGFYCLLYCGKQLKKSVIFLICLLSVMTTIISLPLIRGLIIAKLFNCDPTNSACYTLMNDSISYMISYGIICLLAGAAIEIYAKFIRDNNT